MQIEFAGHSLDISKRELHRDGTHVAIEPQVFDLLVHRLLNRDRVVSKDDMIAHVWAGRIVSDATIDSRIKSVRQALGDDGGTQRIVRTIPRKGVRFVADAREIDPTTGPPRNQAPDPTPPQEGNSASAMSGRPSIAVLAFDNRSDQPTAETLADGLAEDIITVLGRGKDLLVIARNSSFLYKGRVVDVTEIGRALGVRYVLEGSVRRNADQVRITARLSTAETGVQLWAERFDRPMDGAFALQDDIVEAVRRAVERAVAMAERQPALARPATNRDPWEAYQRALGHWASMASDAARQAVEQAIALDPGFAPAYVLRADLLISQGHRGAVPIRDGLAEAETVARTAIALDPEAPEARAILARISHARGDHDGALQHADEAIALGPNNVTAWVVGGSVLTFSGRHDAARQSLRTALRLDPTDPGTRVAECLMGASFYLNRECEAAASQLRSLLLRFPRYSTANRWLLSALSKLGRLEEARGVLALLTEIAPNALPFAYPGRPPGMRGVDYEHCLEGLRATGWRP